LVLEADLADFHAPVLFEVGPGRVDDGDVVLFVACCVSASRCIRWYKLSWLMGLGRGSLGPQRVLIDDGSRKLSNSGSNGVQENASALGSEVEVRMSTDLQSSWPWSAAPGRRPALAAARPTTRPRACAGRYARSTACRRGTAPRQTQQLHCRAARRGQLTLGTWFSIPHRRTG